MAHLACLAVVGEGELGSALLPVGFVPARQQLAGLLILFDLELVVRLAKEEQLHLLEVGEGLLGFD